MYLEGIYRALQELPFIYKSSTLLRCQPVYGGHALQSGGRWGFLLRCHWDERILGTQVRFLEPISSDYNLGQVDFTMTTSWMTVHLLVRPYKNLWTASYRCTRMPSRFLQWPGSGISLAFWADFVLGKPVFCIRECIQQALGPVSAGTTKLRICLWSQWISGDRSWTALLQVRNI